MWKYPDVFKRKIICTVYFFALLLLTGCMGSLAKGSDDASSFSKIKRIAILKVEFRRGYKKLGSTMFSVPYINTLQKKGYKVITELEVRDKLSKKGLDIDNILRDGNYEQLNIPFADAGIIARFQENMVGPLSCFTELVDLNTGRTIWYKTKTWKNKKRFGELQLNREIDVIFSSFPYAR